MANHQLSIALAKAQRTTQEVAVPVVQRIIHMSFTPYGIMSWLADDLAVASHLSSSLQKCVMCKTINVDQHDRRWSYPRDSPLLGWGERKGTRSITLSGREIRKDQTARDNQSTIFMESKRALVTEAHTARTGVCEILRSWPPAAIFLVSRQVDKWRVQTVSILYDTRDTTIQNTSGTCSAISYDFFFYVA